MLIDLYSLLAPLLDAYGYLIKQKNTKVNTNIVQIWSQYMFTRKYIVGGSKQYALNSMMTGQLIKLEQL